VYKHRPKFFDGLDLSPEVGDIILESANPKILPARFKVCYAEDNHMKVTDTTTGKQILVPQKEYRVVRRVLIQLFG
jgi:hypothetical protein